MSNELYTKLDLSTQETMLLNSLEEFYKNKEYFLKLNSIINGTDLISRRTIEFFVTNYSLYHNIVYDLEEKGTIIKFNIHISYKDQLKAHKKRYFDPFGRGVRIPFFAHDDCIITTIGQLNFYKWFFSKKIYEYCKEHYSDIQNSLLNNQFSVKKKKNKTPTKTNYKKINNSMNYDYIPKMSSNNGGDIVVSFDV